MIRGFPILTFMCDFWELPIVGPNTPLPKTFPILTFREDFWIDFSQKSPLRVCYKGLFQKSLDSSFGRVFQFSFCLDFWNLWSFKLNIFVNINCGWSWWKFVPSEGWKEFLARPIAGLLISETMFVTCFLHPS